MATNTAVDVVMPQMGVSVSEGTVTKWAKNVGDTIEADETLLEISTDKVDTEVPSPASGVVSEILVQEGETVEVGTVLARIGGEPGAAAPAPAAPEPEPAPAPEPADAARRQKPRLPPQRRVKLRRAEPPLRNRRSRMCKGTARRSSPRWSRASRPSTGSTRPRYQVPAPAGGSRRRTSFRLSRAAAQAPQAPAPEAPPQPAPVRRRRPLVHRPLLRLRPQRSPQRLLFPASVGSAQAGESLEPMSAMRRGIAEHMRRSLDTSAHVTSAIEVDMTRVVQIREKLKKEYQSAYGVNPTYLAFIARATVETLRDYPWVNGELRGDQIVTRTYVNLGFAVELADGKGLIVPNVKNAETLNLLGMAKSIAEVANRARNKQLTPDDVAGGTFTITNPGGYGTFHGTPVISQPQAGILGTYAIVKRPWVITDENGADAIAIRSMMNLTLTYDHRLVDGAYAGRFLRDLRERLQSWGETDY